MNNASLKLDDVGEDDQGTSDGDESNVDVVYRRLRAAILSGELKAGARLSQVQLAAQFDMSRAPLREALRLLEQEALVDTRHRRMVRVAPISIDDLDELYAMRIVNESHAVRVTVPSLAETDIRDLRRDLAAMKSDADDEDWMRWEENHRRFHLKLCSGAGPRTLRLIQELFDHASRYRSLYRYVDGPHAYERASLEHAQLVEACVSRDEVEASTFLARHLARTALTLFAETAPDHEPLLVREATRFVIPQPEPEPPRRQRRAAT
jgi:DNA-binding GntR family transcriptional regulator